MPDPRRLVFRMTGYNSALTCEEGVNDRRTPNRLLYPRGPGDHLDGRWLPEHVTLVGTFLLDLCQSVCLLALYYLQSDKKVERLADTFEQASKRSWWERKVS